MKARNSSSRERENTSCKKTLSKISSTLWGWQKIEVDRGPTKNAEAIITLRLMYKKCTVGSRVRSGLLGQQSRHSTAQLWKQRAWAQARACCPLHVSVLYLEAIALYTKVPMFIKFLVTITYLLYFTNSDFRFLCTVSFWHAVATFKGMAKPFGFIVRR